MAADVFGSSSLDDLITGDSANKAYKYLPSFRFLLRVDLMFDVPLKSVKPFMRENEYEHIQEGGLNDYVHLRRKSVTKPFTLVVERYVATDIDDPLPNGYSMTIPLLLFIGRNHGKDMSNPIHNGRWFVFTGARVMNKEYGGLDSERSGLLTETITIGYNSMYCVTNPSDTDSLDQSYSIKDDGLKKKTKNAKTNTEDTKDTLAGKARLWKFDNTGSKSGVGTASRKLANELDTTAAKEKTRTEMEKLASKWRFNGKAKGGNGSLHQQSGRHGQDSQGNPRYSSSAGLTPAEVTMDVMAGKARKWTMVKGVKAGSGTLSQQFKNSYDSQGNLILNPSTLLPIGAAGDEATMADLTALASLWHFKDKTKGGNDKRHVQNGQHGRDEQGNPMYDATAGQGTAEATGSELQSHARMWKFTTQESIAGNNILSARTHRGSGDQGTGLTESPRTDMMDKAALWSFSSKSKGGAGKSSRQSGLETELELSKMITAARRWEIVKDSKTGSGVASRDSGNIKEPSKGDMAGRARKAELKPKQSEKPVPKKWPEVSSAQKNPNTGVAPEVRKWPPVKSAAKRTETGTDPKARKWPPEKSAAKRTATGSEPKARKWPPNRSAASITDFLMS